MVANNVSVDIFPKEKTEVWEIEDADESELDKIKRIVDDIEERVKELKKRMKI